MLLILELLKIIMFFNLDKFKYLFSELSILLVFLS